MSNVLTDLGSERFDCIDVRTRGDRDRIIVRRKCLVSQDELLGSLDSYFRGPRIGRLDEDERACETGKLYGMIRFTGNWPDVPKTEPAFVSKTPNRAKVPRNPEQRGWTGQGAAREWASRKKRSTSVTGVTHPPLARHDLRLIGEDNGRDVMTPFQSTHSFLTDVSVSSLDPPFTLSPMLLEALRAKTSFRVGDLVSVRFEMVEGRP